MPEAKLIEAEKVTTKAEVETKKQELPVQHEPVKVISFYQRNKKHFAVAASVALFSVLSTIGISSYLNSNSEEDVYRIAYAPTWARWFTPEQTIRVSVTAHKSPLRSLEFVTLKIKDAVCDHFRTVAGKRPSVDTQTPDMRVHAFLSADTVTLYLDTSGDPLLQARLQAGRGRGAA